MKVVAWWLLLISPITALASDTEKLAAIEAEIAALAARMAVLEAETRALKQRRMATPEGRAIDSVDAETAAPVRDRYRLSGDFRYRYEQIDRQGAKNQSRSRIRARPAILVDLGDDVDLGFGLSTGGTSPTSSTQTLGDGGSKKDITLDLAYVDWEPYQGMHVLAGKFRNPLFRVPSQTLLWDDEWRPEGLAVHYENSRVFAAFLGTWLESDSLAPAREWAAGIHAGIYRPLGAMRLTAGAGYFEIGAAGKGTFFGSDVAFAGNSFACSDASSTADCVHVLDYREIELFGALDFERDEFVAKLYGHYLKNLDANRFDRGWTLGVRLQNAWQDQPLQFDYFYRSLGADAAYAQLTDSDFGGGGSDVEGHYLKAGWSVTRNWRLSLTWFDNRIGADGGMARAYNRIQLDADFRL